jgi:hypothetical protein
MPAVSRLTNGNFNLPNSTAAPANWTTWSAGTGAYANHEIITPTNSVKGNYDGTYQMTAGATTTTGSGGVYQIVPATAGLNYTLTVSSGVQNWYWPSGEMRIFFLNSLGAGLATNVLSVTTGITGYDIGKPCQPYQLSATAPAGTAQAKVEFAGYGGGSVWFDNAVLMESNSLPALVAVTTLPFTVYPPAPPVSQTNAILSLANNRDGSFTLGFAGTVGVAYYVQTVTNLTPPADWQPLAGSTNTVTNGDGSWFFTVTNSGPQDYYRSAAANP